MSTGSIDNAEMIRGSLEEADELDSDTWSGVGWGSISRLGGGLSLCGAARSDKISSFRALNITHRAVNGIQVFLEIVGIEFRWSSKCTLDSLPDELAAI